MIIVFRRLTLINTALKYRKYCLWRNPFEGTLAENICFKTKYSENNLRWALEGVQLKGLCDLYQMD
jgi:hypothetical protein